MDAIIRIITSLKNWVVLIYGVETDGDETKKTPYTKQEGGFLGILMGTLGALMLGNIFTEKAVLRAGRCIVIWVIWINIFSSTPYFE